MAVRNLSSPTMIRRYLFLPFLLLLAIPVAVQGRLVFDNEMVRVSTDFGDRESRGIFTFTNTGTEPVAITNVRTSCGCTTTELAKRDYAPGESGRIEAKLDIAQRQGLQRKTVYVSTDAPDGEYQLMFETVIPVLQKVTPRVLTWRKGEEPEAQIIDVHFSHSDPIHVTSVENPAGGFDVEVEVVEEGKHYRIVATPLSTDAAKRSTLKINTDFPRNAPRHHFGYLLIR